MALADLLKAQLAEIDAAVVQVDEANVTGSPRRRPDRGGGDQPGARGGRRRPRRRSTSASATTAARRSSEGPTRSSSPSSTRCEADHVVLEFARRPEAELEMLREVKPAARARDRRDRHQGQRGRDARPGRPADRARGQLSGPRADRVRPPRLRALDAAAQRGRRQDAGPRRRPRPLRPWWRRPDRSRGRGMDQSGSTVGAGTGAEQVRVEDTSCGGRPSYRTRAVARLLPSATMGIL